MTLITDDNEVAVVKLYYAEEELYREGFERFEDAPVDEDNPYGPDALGGRDADPSRIDSVWYDAPPTRGED